MRPDSRPRRPGWTRGTIEQIFVSPIRPFIFILGKVTPYAAIALREMLLILVTGILWFHVPFKGRPFLLIVISMLYVLCTVSIGVFISTLSRNLQQAPLLSFFFIFPVMFLSGTLVPIESMPLAMQYLSYLSPIRYYMEIALGIFLKGTGFDILWPQFLAMFIFGLIIFPLSLRRLGKQMN